MQSLLTWENYKKKYSFFTAEGINSSRIWEQVMKSLFTGFQPDLIDKN